LILKQHHQRRRKRRLRQKKFSPGQKREKILPRWLRSSQRIPRPTKRREN
jgi:hypothetical protein